MNSQQILGNRDSTSLRYSNYKSLETGFDDIQAQQPVDESVIDPEIQKTELFQNFLKHHENQQQILESMPTSGSLILSRDDFDRLDPEIRRHYIYDQDTNEVLDSRCGEIVKSIIPEQTKMVSSTKAAWKEFWSKSKELEEQLLDAAENGDLVKVGQLLDLSKIGQYIDINGRGLDDWTALHYASNEGKHLVVGELCIRGANFELLTKNTKRTPLHLSAQRGSLLTTKILVGVGAQINIQDIDLNTPLHLASIYGHYKIVQFLLESKADPYIQNCQKAIALDLSQDVVTKVFKDFGIIPKNGQDYTRSQIPGTDVVLRNSRNDFIQKILQFNSKNQPTTKKEESKQQQPQNNNIKQVQSGQKWKNLEIQMSSINSKINPNPQNEKLNYKNFIFYQLLGKGSFGEVYLVEKIGQVPKKQYALKILKKDKMISQNLMRYAQTEKNVLSIMQHPFIVGLNYAFQTETRLFLAMDFCPGGDLSTLLDVKRKLSEDVAKIYVAEILLALGALHQAQIIFRDLKPENVVLDEDGHAMLTDFGLSKMGVQEGVANKSFCGSPAYLPPEILTRAGHNRQVDWYLLGVMTYELIVGIPPYYANEREQLFENIKKGPLKLPRTLSPESKDFIVSLLNRDPMKRLGSKRDFEEVKEHPWLSSIDWNDCFQRKLKPPKIEKKNFSTIPMEINFEDSDNTRNKIDSWTFYEEIQVE